MQRTDLPYLIKWISEEGNEQAFDALMRYYYPGLLSFACSILNDRPLSEEVIQDIFVQLWVNRKTLPAIQNLSNYLYRAVKQSCYTQFAKRKKIHFEEPGESLPVAYTAPDSTLISRENLQQIADAVNQLPSRCRLIFRLVKDEGLKYKEVAEILDLSVKTVEAQMSIALKTLSRALEAAFPEEGRHFFRKKRSS
ncbi:RNA polymerase sigma-70 factor [Niabella drilacis]|uniref:RNA polymerase sigma-70 factor, ECF subfamily n=1 Tax=Niabella drilacis (strain DSM 25811 / CCM 8410 / CCUG 62505 / LMG 26954 / E90) TaxID=1285928 RepID=A0A1G6RK22_NIADE|nr:RNA polymerase sigma-70 factor [Niabella drilacis]SDD04982.1 RNA polymerase sigma-70 factor, ECF subfamily [Niabella drilacis]